MAPTILQPQAKAVRAGVEIYTSQPGPAGGRTEHETHFYLSVDNVKRLIKDIERVLPEANKFAKEEAVKGLKAAEDDYNNKRKLTREAHARLVKLRSKANG